MKVVVNAGPLIALGKLGYVHLLHRGQQFPILALLWHNAPSCLQGVQQAIDNYILF